MKTSSVSLVTSLVTMLGTIVYGGDTGGYFSADHWMTQQESTNCHQVSDNETIWTHDFVDLSGRNRSLSEFK